MVDLKEITLAVQIFLRAVHRRSPSRGRDDCREPARDDPPRLHALLSAAPSLRHDACFGALDVMPAMIVSLDMQGDFHIRGHRSLQAPMV